MSDLDAGVSLVMRGKIPPSVPHIRDKPALRRIFAAAAKADEEALGTHGGAIASS